MSSFKKAHKTHAFAQPAGVPYPHRNESEPAGLRGSSDDEHLLLQFLAICELVDDSTERTRMLGVSLPVDMAWREGKMLPLLRAQRKSIELALRELRDAGR